MQFSVPLRNGLGDRVQSYIGTYPILEIRTGSPPANCAAARTGTVLASLTLPSTWMTAAAAGAISLSGTWQDPAANASGVAGHFCIYDSGGATCHIQGTICQTAPAWAGSHAYSVNDKITNGSYVYICTTAGTSAASGGPTGTGTGITDGAAVWDYLCLASGDMTLANVQLTINETFTITTGTITMGNV